jgi:hypothetical protein
MTACSRFRTWASAHQLPPATRAGARIAARPWRARSGTVDAPAPRPPSGRSVTQDAVTLEEVLAGGRTGTTRKTFSCGSSRGDDGHRRQHERGRTRRRADGRPPQPQPRHGQEVERGLARQDSQAPETPARSPARARQSLQNQRRNPTRSRGRFDPVEREPDEPGRRRRSPSHPRAAEGQKDAADRGTAATPARPDPFAASRLPSAPAAGRNGTAAMEDHPRAQRRKRTSLQRWRAQSPRSARPPRARPQAPGAALPRAPATATVSASSVLGRGERTRRSGWAR